LLATRDSGLAYMRELGFFFFLRMAVAISSSCGGSVSVASAEW
jgi:hypothetical protein